MGIAVRRIQGSHLWAIQSSYFSRALVTAAKEIPGMTWDAARRSWVGYVDAVEATADLLVSRKVLVERSLLAKYEADNYTHHVFFATHGADGRLLRAYQKTGVDFAICQAPTGAILADEMGCIDGEAIVRVCRAGLSFECTLAEFYSKFKTWAPGSTKIRSLCDGVFRLNDIVDVLDKGTRPVFEITLNSGKRIKATGDHEILTDTGYVRVDELQPLDNVITNGVPRCVRCGSIKNVVVDTTKKFVGFCRKCIYGALRTNGRARPAGEVRDKDGYVRISGHRDHPRANRAGQVLEHILVMEKRLGRHLTDDERVHHKNEIKHDNVDSNLELLTKSEHARLHGRDGGFRRLHGGVSAKGGLVVFEPKTDRVVARVAAGEAHVYDVVCADPHRNFVANGIVVHNCGKSAEAVIAARAFGGKTLVVCPSSARSVWADPQRGEIAKWWKGFKGGVFQPAVADPTKHVWRYLQKHKAFVCKLCNCVPPVDGDQGDAPSPEAPLGRKPKTPNTCDGHRPGDAQIFVIHVDILHSWVDQIIEWGPSNIVLDEGHLYQNEKSRRSKAAREVRQSPTVLTALALTGTPLTNRVRDLWNLIDIISPGRVGKNFFKFGIRYCAGHQEEVSRDIGAVWDFTGQSNLDELRKRLARFTLRRTKEEVKLELPPKTRQIIRMEVPAKFQQQSVEKINKRLLNAVMVRAVDGKLPQVIQLAKDHLEGGQSVVVFTFRRIVAEHITTKLSATGFPCRFIHGDVLQKKRDRILNELRDASQVGPVLLCATIDCTAVAIDLTFASAGIVAELTYEPHELLQAEARLHRFGQQNNVLIQYPIALGTVEEAIAEVVIDRLDTFETLIGKTDGLSRALAGDEEEDLIAKLGEKLFAMTTPRDVELKTGKRKVLR